MAKNKALSDSEVLSLVEAEISAASGFSNGELAEERADAMDRYLGEPLGDEVEGRSQALTREVLDTVETIMPSMMRIFTDEETLCQFTPIGPEDAPFAEQETKLVNHVFWNMNRGFYNLYTALKDGLLSKSGILMCYFDESENTEREEYTGLNEIEFAQLADPAMLASQGVQREIDEIELTEDGINVVFKTTRDKGRVKVDVLPPEEFGVSREARSPFSEDQTFCYARRKMSATQLIEMGYDEDIIKTLPTDDDVETEERLARRHLDDEQEGLYYSNHWSLHTYWITEAYIKLDRNGDGLAENLKVTVAAGTSTGAGARLLDIEEIDRFPFHSWSPILLTHKFYGLSVADLVREIQEIKTALLRGMLDNAYLSNNGRLVVNDDYVELDDVLSSRPNQIIRYNGEGAWNQYIGALPNNPLPNDTFNLMEYMDELKKRRVGAGEETAALDNAALANVNTGVFALAHDKARAKIELIARVFSELCLKSLFLHIHELMRKNVNRELTAEINGQFITTNPATWRERTDVKAVIGVGSVSKERKLLGLEKTLELQAIIAEKTPPGMLVAPQNIYKALYDLMKNNGLQPEYYFSDPAQFQPPPPQPDPMQQAQMMLMQAQAQNLQADGQSKVMRSQADMQKNQIEAQMKQVEMAAKAQESRLRQQIDGMRMQLEAMRQRSEVDTRQQEMVFEQTIKALEVRMQREQMELQQQMMMYKTQLDNIIKLVKIESDEEMKLVDNDREDARRMYEAMKSEVDYERKESMGYEESEAKEGPEEAD